MDKRVVKKIRISKDAINDESFVGHYVVRKAEGARAILLVIDNDSSKYTVECNYSGSSVDVTGD